MLQNGNARYRIYIFFPKNRFFLTEPRKTGGENSVENVHNSLYTREMTPVTSTAKKLFHPSIGGGIG